MVVQIFKGRAQEYSLANFCSLPFFEGVPSVATQSHFHPYMQGKWG
jgi:hypothetical protein